MTPTPRHIEEARRLAVKALAQSEIRDVNMPAVNDLVDALDLPTLLAAQEKLETLRKSAPDPIRDHFAACQNCKPVMCCSGNECGCQGLPVDFEPTDKCDNYCLNLTHRRLLEATKGRDQLRAERDELKERIKELEHPRIYSRCPACNNDTLTLNKGKLLCTWHECKNPTVMDYVGT